MLPNVNTSTEYCMYLRKSRMDEEAEARGEGDTLARHRRTLLDLSRRLGLTVTMIYEEVVSGETISARPEVQKLLHDVEEGRWRGVLCMEVERLARGNTSDQGLIADTFKYSNTQIITPLKTYDPNDEFDEEFFEFGLFRSRMEYRAINRRLQRGREASLREGKYIAGAAPYGYERYKLPKQKGYSLRIVPEKAEVVKQIFQWYIQGEADASGAVTPMGSSSIAKRLDSMGIPSPSGGKWPACSVRDILSNPTYAGKIRWSFRPTVKLMIHGRRTVTRPVDHNASYLDGVHTPIVDEVTWARAQQIMKSRSHAPVPKSTQIQNPLAGLIYCSKCGRSMLRLQPTHGRASLRCPNKDCDCVSSPLDEVEAAVLHALEVWLAEYKVKLARLPAAQQAGSEAAEREITRLEQSISTINKQLDSLYDLVESGVYSTELFTQRSKALNHKLTAAYTALEAAQARLSSHRQLRQNRFEVIPSVEHVLATYPTLTSPAEKNALLRGVLDRAIYTKTKGGRYTPGDMQVYLFPKLSPPPSLTLLP